MCKKSKTVASALVPFKHILVAVLNSTSACPYGTRCENAPDHLVCSTLTLAKQALLRHQGSGTIEAWAIDSDDTMTLWRKVVTGRRRLLKHLEQIDTSYYWPGRTFDPADATIYEVEDMPRMSRTHAEHPAPPPQKPRPTMEPKKVPDPMYSSSFPPMRLSTIRLDLIGSDGAEIWIDTAGEPYLLANLTRRTLGEQVMFGDWWDIRSSNAAFEVWAQTNGCAVPTPDHARKLAEGFLAYLLGLKQLLEVVV